MNIDIIETLALRLLKIPQRLERVVTAYLLTLMLAGPKKTLSYAAGVSGLHKSQFSRLLSEHSDLAVSSLKLLAIDAAKEAGASRKPLISGCPWTMALMLMQLFTQDHLYLFITLSVLIMAKDLLSVRRLKYRPPKF